VWFWQTQFFIMWWHVIMVYAQAVKTKSKWKWRHPYISITRGMKFSPDVCSTYDCALPYVAIIIACIIIVDIHYTIYVWVESAIMTSIKVWKSPLVIRISTHHRVWWRKRWEASFWTCAPLFKTIVAIIFQSVSWVVVHSLLKRHWSKWIFKLSMEWPHWHCEKWVIIRCGKPKRVHSVVRKWIEDKQNAGVIGRTNNQMFTLQFAHDRRCAHMISKSLSNKSEANFCSWRRSNKEAYN